jgi:hypothetical protein
MHSFVILLVELFENKKFLLYPDDGSNMFLPYIS